MISRVLSWLADRAGFAGCCAGAPERRLSAGTGWLHTLGVVVVALFFMQAVTGIVMAMHYSPHPDAAYESTRFIDEQLPGGRLVRSMHHYGDSALLIVAVLHLLRGLAQGTYRQPRELLWLAGIFVLQILMGFGFTGSLLPWDQNAYWATLVRTQYPAEIPVVGPVMQVLLRGNHDIGSLTLTRFYALHALVLPALFLLGLQGYALLAWRRGPEPSPEGAAGPGPTQARQWVRGLTLSLAAVGAVVVFSLLRPAELEFKADPADATYHPRAEWYFLWLFQTIRDWSHLPGVSQIPGWLPALGIPGAAMGFLALAPWLDRHPARRLAKRPIILGPLVAGLLGVGFMTVRAYSELQENATPSRSILGHVRRGAEKLNPVAVNRGRELFGSANPVPCSACHKAYADFKGRTAPDLTAYGRKTIPMTPIPNHPEMEAMSFYARYAAYLRGTLRPEKTVMPQYAPESLSDAEMADIAAYLSQDSATEKREREAALIRSRHSIQ